MSNIASWLSPELLRTLGWTLLHFLWQGAALAALLAVLFLIGWVGGVCAWFYIGYHHIRSHFNPSHQSKVLAGIKAWDAFWLFGTRVCLFSVLVWLPGFVLILWLAGTFSR